MPDRQSKFINASQQEVINHEIEQGEGLCMASCAKVSIPMGTVLWLLEPVVWVAQSPALLAAVGVLETGRFDVDGSSAEALAQRLLYHYPRMTMSNGKFMIAGQAAAPIDDCATRRQWQEPG